MGTKASKLFGALAMLCASATSGAATTREILLMCNGSTFFFDPPRMEFPEVIYAYRPTLFGWTGSRNVEVMHPDDFYTELEVNGRNIVLRWRGGVFISGFPFRGTKCLELPRLGPGTYTIRSEAWEVFPTMNPFVPRPPLTSGRFLEAHTFSFTVVDQPEPIPATTPLALTTLAAALGLTGLIRRRSRSGTKFLER